GIGYVDLAGNCRLSFDQVYIRREGRPNPYIQKRDLRSLYAPKAERVLRVLMAHPYRQWKLTTLAREAEVSLGQAYNVKKLLRDREVSSGANLRLIEPYDDGVFYGAREVEGASVVSPAQLYLDLLNTAGRGEEAAAALLEQVIKPQWQVHGQTTTQTW